jgi:hypothetical protein
MTRFILSLVTGAAFAGTATAQAPAPETPPAPDRPWTASLSVSGASADGDASGEFRNASLSLERRFAGAWLGASIGASGGDILIPEFVSVIDASSLQGALWWGVDLGGFNLTASAGHGRQSLEAGLTPPARAPAQIRNRQGEVDGEITTTSIGLTLSAQFGEGLLWSPYATLTHTESETDVSFEGSGGARLGVSRTQSGLSGGVGVDLSLPASPSVDVLGGVGVLAAEDGSSLVYTRLRPGGFQPSTAQGEGGVEWAEIYAGARFALGGGASLSGTLGTTLGLDRDEAFASAGLSWTF